MSETAVLLWSKHEPLSVSLSASACPFLLNLCFYLLVCCCLSLFVFLSLSLSACPSLLNHCHYLFLFIWVSLCQPVIFSLASVFICWPVSLCLSVSLTPISPHTPTQPHPHTNHTHTSVNKNTLTHTPTPTHSQTHPPLQLVDFGEVSLLLVEVGLLEVSDVGTQHGGGFHLLLQQGLQRSVLLLHLILSHHHGHHRLPQLLCGQTQTWTGVRIFKTPSTRRVSGPCINRAEDLQNSRYEGLRTTHQQGWGSSKHQVHGGSQITTKAPLCADTRMDRGDDFQNIKYEDGLKKPQRLNRSYLPHPSTSPKTEPYHKNYLQINEAVHLPTQKTEENLEELYMPFGSTKIPHHHPPPILTGVQNSMSVVSPLPPKKSKVEHILPWDIYWCACSDITSEMPPSPSVLALKR